LDLTRLVEAGKLRARVAATFPLVEAAAAPRQSAAGHTNGKIALIP
jgi:NADPH2:quinone reductase